MGGHFAERRHQNRSLIDIWRTIKSKNVSYSRNDGTADQQFAYSRGAASQPSQYWRGRMRPGSNIISRHPHVGLLSQPVQPDRSCDSTAINYALQDWLRERIQ